jgi:deoxyribodipyrimidine photo-lyase
MPIERLPALHGLDRTSLVAVIRKSLPGLTGEPSRDGAFVGGTAAAAARLAAIDPAAYGRSRNFLDGAVTGLSPWIRHGVLSLAEVRDHALMRVEQPEDAEKLVSELGWRDYWRRVHARLGDAIGRDLEPPAAMPRRPALDRMPEDVLSASTGMPCIDAFVRQLHETGWLHNHARMWLASWLVHVRGVRWQAGAEWFLEHLLDGDPASNHLSWQWVAGTFSAKPYLFNRENLERYTAGVHCRGCPLLGRCDVEGSYEELTARLFHATPSVEGRPSLKIPAAPAWQVPSPAPSGGPTLVWLTLDAASESGPAAAAFPGSPKIFVLDPAWLEAEKPTLKRLVFLFECLAEIPNLSVVLGDPGEAVAAEAESVGAGRVAVADTPCPWTRARAEAIGRKIHVEVVPWPQFVDDRKVDDLTRFSRYWRKVEKSAMSPAAGRSSRPA